MESFHLQKATIHRYTNSSVLHLVGVIKKNHSRSCMLVSMPILSTSCRKLIWSPTRALWGCADRTGELVPWPSFVHFTGIM